MYRTYGSRVTHGAVTEEQLSRSIYLSSMYARILRPTTMDGGSAVHRSVI